MHISTEKADSHNHVVVKGNNFLSAVLLISGYDDATLSQNSVSGKVSNRSRQLESFLSQSISLAIHFPRFQRKAKTDFLLVIGHLH